MSEDFCHTFTTVEATVVQCSCRTRLCNGGETGTQLIGTADQPAASGGAIKCFKCSGGDDKCTDEDDRGRIRSCNDKVTTCTITKLRNMIDGKVLYDSVEYE